MKVQTRVKSAIEERQSIAMIRRGLLEWSAQNPRNLPWKKIEEPYEIWVSEIILQQTRVDQGTEYYFRFLETFPSIKALAEADLDQVMKAWEGLGYYRRAFHMHETAKYLMSEHEGKFPQTHDEIIRLKGIGPYTAAAISSFAFHLPYPVLDGNVMRVISRLFCVDLPVDSSEGRSHLMQRAEQLLDHDKPGQFNQAIMDFGAMICRPRSPDCKNCPLSTYCLANQNDTVNNFPVKRKSKQKKERYFFYLKINKGNQTYIRRRSKADIWQNLYEFYLVEGRGKQSWKDVLHSTNLKIDVVTYSDIYTQALSHQKITARFAEATLHSAEELLLEQGFIKVNQKKLRTFAYPKIIDCYLGDKALNLNSSS
jgi:A/G-specific adenine glycosylase